MSSRCLILALAVTMCVAGCGTMYVKRFVTVKVPGVTASSFAMDDLWCFLTIDAIQPRELQITDYAKEYRDSVYAVLVDVLKERPYRDTTGLSEVFRTLKVEKLSLAVGRNEIVPGVRSIEPLTRHDVFWLTWHYEPIVIPEATDAIRVRLRLTYMRGGAEVVKDTTLNLMRYQFKKTELIGD